SGSITFNLYGPNDATCAGTVLYTNTDPVSANGNYYSTNYTPTSTGTDRCTDSYTGDTANSSSSEACNGSNESTDVVTATTSLSTQVFSSGILLGQTIEDLATLSGGISPISGSITFNLYGPNDATCTGTVAYTNTVTVSGNGNYSSGTFTPT